jgi:hypothetical protein
MQPVIALGTNGKFSRLALVTRLHGEDAHATLGRLFLEKRSDLAQNGSSKIRCVIACQITCCDLDIIFSGTYIQFRMTTGYST